MPGRMQHLELVFEPGRWTVTLTDGAHVQVSADGYGREGDMYVFSLLVQGEPNFELDVVKIPVSSVSQIRGGSVV